MDIPGDAFRGELLTCPDCGLDYEVVELNSGSVVIKAAEIEGEDWGE